MATEMFLWRARPFGPGRCELDQIVMHPVPEGSPPQPPPTHEVYENFRDYDTGLTLFQDFSNIWEVHAGMQQQSFSGTYCASKQEMRIAHMHDVIDRYIEGKPFEQMP
jgi:hypothetical protein